MTTGQIEIAAPVLKILHFGGDDPPFIPAIFIPAISVPVGLERVWRREGRVWEGNQPNPSTFAPSALCARKRIGNDPWAKERAPRRIVAKRGCYSSSICRRDFVPSKDFFRDFIKRQTPPISEPNNAGSDALAGYKGNAMKYEFCFDAPVCRASSPRHFITGRGSATVFAHPLFMGEVMMLDGTVLR